MLCQWKWQRHKWEIRQEHYPWSLKLDQIPGLLTRDMYGWKACFQVCSFQKQWRFSLQVPCIQVILVISRATQFSIVIINWERYPNAGRVQPIHSAVKTSCNISEQTTLTSKAETYREENMSSLVIEVLLKLCKNQHSSCGLHPTGALKCQYFNNMYQWHFLCITSL